MISSSVRSRKVTRLMSAKVRKPKDTSSALGAATIQTDTAVMTSWVRPDNERSMCLPSEALRGLPKILPSSTTMVSAPMTISIPV